VYGTYHNNCSFSWEKLADTYLYCNIHTNMDTIHSITSNYFFFDVQLQYRITFGAWVVYAAYVLPTLLVLAVVR
jgi:hypothetical protein